MSLIWSPGTVLALRSVPCPLTTGLTNSLARSHHRVALVTSVHCLVLWIKENALIKAECDLDYVLKCFDKVTLRDMNENLKVSP